MDSGSISPEGLEAHTKLSSAKMCPSSSTNLNNGPVINLLTMPRARKPAVCTLLSISALIDCCKKFELSNLSKKVLQIIPVIVHCPSKNKVNIEYVVQE